MAIAGIPSGTASIDFTAMREKMFKETDSDGDGSVSKTEFLAAHEKHQAKGPKSPTGALSAEEMFKSADTNGDESVSKDEFAAMLAEVESKMAASGSADAGGRGGAGKVGGPPAGGPPPGGAPHGGASGAKSSSSTDDSESANTDPADANGDGTVSAMEQIAYDLAHPEATETAS